MGFNRIGELRIDSARFSSLLCLSSVHRLAGLVHIFAWGLHNPGQNLHNHLIVLALLALHRWTSAGKSLETRGQRLVARWVKRFFPRARYAGGKSPTYRQRQNFKFDFVSFFSSQAIEQ